MIFKKIKIYLLIGSLICSFLGGWFSNGWRLNLKHTQFKLELSEAAVKETEHVLEIERLNAENVNLTNIKIGLEKDLQTAKGKETIVEVIKYEENNVNADYVLDDDFVRIYNKTIRTIDPNSTAFRVDGESNGIQNLGQLLKVIQHNNELCAKAVTELNGWQEWFPTVTCN